MVLGSGLGRVYPNEKWGLAIQVWSAVRQWHLPLGTSAEPCSMGVSWLERPAEAAIGRLRGDRHAEGYAAQGRRFITEKRASA